MEIKPGYKLTEVGVIPEDWTVNRLSGVTDLQVGYAFKSAWFTMSRGVPLFRGENVGYGRADWSDTRRLPQELAAGFAKYELRPNDVVIGMDRTFAKSGAKITLLRTEDCPCLLVQRVGRFIPVKCSRRFLWAVFSGPGFQRSLETEQKGMDIPHLSRSEILNPFVPLPPTTAEQDAIANALSDADALIESLEQLIAKKCEIKQGATQELLRPKEGWLATKLGDLGPFLKGSGVRKDQSMSGELPCVRYGEIYTVHTDYIRAFQSRISPAVAAGARRLKPGDLLFAGSGETKEEIGKCVAFVDDIEAYAGGDIVILRPERSNSTFLGYYLNTAPINRQKASMGQGDAVVHISFTALSNIELTMPPIAEQNTIAAVLRAADDEISALRAKLTKARQIKQGMMQELLTGRTRLI